MLTLRGRGNFRSQKRKIPMDNAIRVWHCKCFLADAVAYTRKLVGDEAGLLELEDLPKAQSPMEMLMGQTTPA
ncbi:MAG: hypothetical protein DWI22_19405, partial [Planctomycetota bacterium]